MRTAEELLPTGGLITRMEARLLIRTAQREAFEEAAKVADPPLMHRKGPPGLWRQRRAAIAAAIRALSTGQHQDKQP